MGSGSINAGCDNIDVLIEGESVHGAYPHLGSDPVLATSATITGLHTLVGRRIDPLHAAVLTVGELQAGTTANVIPPPARASLTLHTYVTSDRAGFAIAPAWRSCGSDDFAFFGELAPTAIAFAGLAGAPGLADYPLHHPEFLPPDEAVGAVARGQAVLYLAAASR
jgi:metal-dependent amidase/aminoacylase/carboxypeptidase family protein